MPVKNQKAVESGIVERTQSGKMRTKDIRISGFWGLAGLRYRYNEQKNKNSDCMHKN